MADTIKTGITLIEEGGLIPESLRFESEPWTFFYMAGEIIQELRKASGKQSKHGQENGRTADQRVVFLDRAASRPRLYIAIPNSGLLSG